MLKVLFNHLKFRKKKTNLEKFGVGYSSQSPIIQEKMKKSNGEKEVLEYITSILPPNAIIEPNIRTIIPPYELDIYLPEYNLAIEYNGEYWHKNSQALDNLKKRLCKDLNIKLLTVWENPWLFNPTMIQNVLQQAIYNTSNLS